MSFSRQLKISLTLLISSITLILLQFVAIDNGITSLQDYSITSGILGGLGLWLLPLDVDKKQKFASRIIIYPILFFVALFFCLYYIIYNLNQTKVSLFIHIIGSICLITVILFIINMIIGVINIIIKVFKKLNKQNNSFQKGVTTIISITTLLTSIFTLIPMMLNFI